jgi:hypothetical protein
VSTSTLSAWPVGALERTFPLDQPPRDAARKAKAGWQLCAAGGEYVTFQIGLRTDVKLADVEATVEPLRGPKGEIPSEAFQVRWVGLVPVPHDAFSMSGAERPEYVPGWYPDPLTEQPPWNGSNPPRAAGMHLTFFVPPKTAAGVYRGRVTVRVKGKSQACMPVTLEVWPFAIPRRPSFHVTNWFQLDCVTKWHRCDPWSERHWRLLDLYAKEMAAHRQDVITTPTLIGNFHNSDPMTLVDAVREKDGSYRFDLRRLERWVKLFDAHGFRYFEMWHLAAQGHGKTAPPFGVYDTAKGKRVSYDKLAVTSPTYRQIVGAFLDEMSKWLDKRGLSDRFLLHVFDEPRKDQWPHYARLSAFYRQHAPKLKHIDAISTSELITQFGGDVDIPVPLTPHLADDAYYQQRARGKTGSGPFCPEDPNGRLRNRRARANDARRKTDLTRFPPVWWYTCCGPSERYANRFVFMPLICPRILQWQAFVLGISGYLHWGYNFWHRLGQNASGWPGINVYADHTLVNPYREHPARWGVGDACIVYPDPQWWLDKGPVSSLRYEAMREGLQDYELLRMLEDAVTAGAGKGGPSRAEVVRTGRRLLAQVRGPIAGSLTDFTRDPAVLLRAREDIGRTVVELA